MQLTILNLTDNGLFYASKGTPTGSLTRLPSCTSAVLPKRAHSFVLATWQGRSKAESSLDFDLDEKSVLEDVGVGELPTTQFFVDSRRAEGLRWKVLRVPDGCPWRIYRYKTSRRRYNVMIFPRRDMASFLSDVPDDIALSSACLPGTHDTMAFYGWPVSQCQSVKTPLLVQLASGIRVLDIRLSINKGRLMAYHGQYPQRATFMSILTDLYDFLTSPGSARETVVVSVKQEDYDNHTPEAFSVKVREEIEAGPGGMALWYLKNRIPTLGEVRGKAVMFSRFGVDGSAWEGGLEGIGIHPTNWPDSEKSTFTWECKNTLVQTQDWYHIPSFLSIPEKAEMSTNLLIPPETASASNPVLSITYFSASSFPFATPTVVSTGFGWPSFGFGVEGVNSRVARFLLAALSSTAIPAQAVSDAGESDAARARYDEGPELRGWTLMDFFEEPVGSGVVPLLVECNFRGRSGAAGRRG
ncbi:PLC-like phosphodiesterase [Auriscalpium vulgare]|uniref:PLC-like phosphodiesterase n=1 Tax=Auriscalpium vulgare TaxID=40419 RepID=A0ACB8RDF8_9AGAM|nr:PLC-like phosphodiesterase [Auriscalpium vulgare]